MRFVDKKFIIGFVAGFICFPVLYVVSVYTYTYVKRSGIALQPPEVKLIEQRVHLDWDVKTLDGETINLDDQFQGKPVFLNFWATWCPPCKAEMPSIEELYGKFNGRIAFACVSNESIGDLRKFKEKNGYTMPIYQIEGYPPESLNVKGIPVTYIISNNRNLSFRYYGGANWAHADVIKSFERMLDKAK